MDPVDKAQMHREAEESETLRRARLGVGKSLYQCEDCFQIIPAARRMAYPGVRKCVRCQKEKEGE
jgi:phage/conjugal plasmid C-4 type zinc finger TraR family protein